MERKERRKREKERKSCKMDGKIEIKAKLVVKNEKNVERE